MSREPIATWFFVLVVVRRGDRVLLVQETKHGQLWYLPAGRVEPGETLVDAAVRETLEEAGIPVRITGIARIEHTPQGSSARLRVVFVGEPVDETPPKERSDEHSLRAAWVPLKDLGAYPVRGVDVHRLLRSISAGAPISPLSILRREGE